MTKKPDPLALVSNVLPCGTDGLFEGGAKLTEGPRPTFEFADWMIARRIWSIRRYIETLHMKQQSKHCAVTLKSGGINPTPHAIAVYASRKCEQRTLNHFSLVVVDRGGECRLHGGLSPGAPRGSRNGNYRRGDWTTEAIEERRWLRSLVQAFAKTGTGR